MEHCGQHSAFESTEVITESTGMIDSRQGTLRSALSSEIRIVYWDQPAWWTGAV